MCEPDIEIEIHPDTSMSEGSDLAVNLRKARKASTARSEEGALGRLGKAGTKSF
jgi:hypothetical protein